MGKIVGVEKYIDSETGQVKDFWVIENEVKDKDFVKVWVSKLITLIEEHDTNEKSLSHYLLVLLEYMDEKNRIILSDLVYQELMEKLKVQKKTIQNILSRLQNYRIVVKLLRGVYVVNPEIASIVRREEREKLLDTWGIVLKFKVKNEPTKVPILTEVSQEEKEEKKEKRPDLSIIEGWRTLGG